MNRNITYALLLLTAMVAIPAASAYENYLTTFNQEYNTSGTKLDTCGLCHVRTGGGGPLNSYGMDFSNNAKNFTAIETLDSDGDGYNNIAEINVLTFPGNRRQDTTTAQIERGSDLKLEDDIGSYEGSISPRSVVYGWKIALENLDETFTFNKSEKLKKQANHARIRISEVKAMINENNDEAVEKALSLYRVKIEQMDNLVSEYSNGDSGLLHAEDMIRKHQYVLENLNVMHPNNKGLARAYNNSLLLQRKFESKVREKLERKEVRAKEETKLRAVIIGNDTAITFKVEFTSDSTENLTIAEDILNKVKLSKENIARIIEIKPDEDEDDFRTGLKAEAEIERGFTNIEAEYRFKLEKVTDRNDIIDGVYLSLNALKIEDIMKVLKIDKDENNKVRKDAIKEVRKDIKEEHKEIEDSIRENRKEIREEQKENEEAIRETRRQLKRED